MKTVNTMLKVVFAVLFACIVSFNIVVDKAMATGEFSQTCQDITLKGSTLSADCEKADGYTLEQSSINLDEYIGNLDGTLSWGDSRFSLTCEDLGLGQSLFNRHYTLSGKCEKRDGYTLESTDIDLDSHIANINGVLTYE
ncbi:MAG: CVNH domain-containing protein [Crocosphaera sp.]|nr:CVNH domain-containing protein [Crocosphaera sp.]